MQVMVVVVKMVNIVKLIIVHLHVLIYLLQIVNNMMMKMVVQNVHLVIYLINLNQMIML